jgi:hypothetical protein
MEDPKNWTICTNYHHPDSPFARLALIAADITALDPAIIIKQGIIQIPSQVTITAETFQ